MSVKKTKYKVVQGKPEWEKPSEKKRAIAEMIPMQGQSTEGADSTPAETAPKDAARARENVSDLVRKSAGAIANGLIEAAKSGQLAQAKYLFEVAGVYPAPEKARSGKDSVVYKLLERLGVPIDPIVDAENSKTLGVEAANGGVAAACEEDVDLRSSGQVRTAGRALETPQPAPLVWGSSVMGVGGDAVE